MHYETIFIPNTYLVIIISLLLFNNMELTYPKLCSYLGNIQQIKFLIKLGITVALVVTSR